MAEYSKRSFLEEILNLSRASAALIGLCLVASTEPSFPNYIFHGEIDGEHIALYPPKQAPLERFGPGSHKLVLEVNKPDGKQDVHPTLDLNNDAVFDFLVNGQITAKSERKTIAYFGDESGELYHEFVIENGAVKEQLKDRKEAARQFTNYIRKIREHRQ